MKALINQQKQYFNSNATKSLDFRIAQLKKLKSVLKDHEQTLTNAIFDDFKKGSFNTFLTEFSGVYLALDKAIKRIKKWAAIKRVRTNMLNSPGSSYSMPDL